MAYDQGQGGFPPRQMVQGNWQCGQCGAAITELPFQPDPNRKVYCRDCHRKFRDNRGGGGGGGRFGR